MQALRCHDTSADTSAEVSGEDEECKRWCNKRMSKHQ